MTATPLDIRYAARDSVRDSVHDSVRDTATPSRRMLWAGRVLTGFAVLFLTFDTVFKFIAAPEAVAGTMELGYTASALRTTASTPS